MTARENIFSLVVVWLASMVTFALAVVNNLPSVAYYSMMAFIILTGAGLLNACFISFPKTTKTIVVVCIVVYALSFWNVKIIKVGTYEVHWLDFLTDVGD